MDRTSQIREILLGGYMSNILEIDVEKSLTVQRGDINFVAYEKLKEEAEILANEIEKVEVTEENIKTNKKMLASVNKSLKILNEERIRVKKLILEPYDTFEKQIKEIEMIVRTADTRVREQVRELEEREREQKKEKLNDIWHKRISQYELASVFNLHDWIEPKHLNKSESMTKVEQDMVDFLERSERDLMTIKSMDGSEIIANYYLKCKDLGMAIQSYKQSHEEIEEIKKVMDDNQSEQVYTIIIFNEEDYRKAISVLEQIGINFK